MWKVLTDAAERKRIEDSVNCIKTCESKHKNDFVLATFCVADECGKQFWIAARILYASQLCSACLTLLETAHCLNWKPTMSRSCSRMPQIILVVRVSFVVHAAVEMLRNSDIAEAVTCAAQCTIPPAANC